MAAFSKENMRIFSWIGGGLATVVAGLWAAFVYFNQHESSTGPKQSADHGGVVIGGNAEHNKISTNPR